MFCRVRMACSLFQVVLSLVRRHWAQLSFVTWDGNHMSGDYKQRVSNSFARGGAGTLFPEDWKEVPVVIRMQYAAFIFELRMRLMKSVCHWTIFILGLFHVAILIITGCY